MYNSVNLFFLWFTIVSIFFSFNISLDKHNCVIASTKLVCENFPWAQFSLVVEYDNEKSSSWQQLCERQHIRHIGLCVKTDKDIGTHLNPLNVHKMRSFHYSQIIILISFLSI